MDIRKLTNSRDFRFLVLVIVEVLICFVVGTAVISLISGKGWSETSIGGAVVALIIVPGYNYLHPQSRSD